MRNGEEKLYRESCSLHLLAKNKSCINIAEHRLSSLPHLAAIYADATHRLST